MISTRPLLLWLFSFALGFALDLAGAPSARAQPMGKTLVVPFAIGPAQPSGDARPIETALQKQRVVLLSLHDAHDRFLAHSRLAQAPAPSDIDALAKEAHAAIEHVALGRTGAAQHSVQHIVALAERSLETLNRETRTARGLLDACLALVRASLHAGQRDEALDQAMRCRRLVPDLAPSDVAHPANVVGALAEADDQLRRMRVGSLSVSAVPERGCEVFLNGRHLGHTPFTLDRAPAGAYRVQVECSGEGSGRVHVVELGDDPVQLTVDSGFDAAIQAEPRLWLRYASDDAARGDLVRHAAQLGREVHAEDVVLVGRVAGALTVLRVQPQHERLLAGTELAGSQPAQLTHAAEALTQARFESLDPAVFRPRPLPEPAQSAVPAAVASQPTPARPATSPSDAAPAPPSARPEASSSPGLIAAGGVLAGLGAAGLATGFGLYAHSVTLRHRAEQGEAGSPPQQQAQSKYEDFRLLPLAGVAGSALLTAAVPMLLPKRPPRHVAGWVGGALAGAAGIAAIAAGTVVTIRNDEGVLGGLLISAGVPLLTIPVTQLVRSAR
jgi:hypothetical protein